VTEDRREFQALLQGLIEEHEPKVLSKRIASTQSLHNISLRKVLSLEQEKFSTGQRERIGKAIAVV
jgi:hypothetical protein